MSLGLLGKFFLVLLSLYLGQLVLDSLLFQQELLLLLLSLSPRGSSILGSLLSLKPGDLYGLVSLSLGLLEKLALLLQPLLDGLLLRLGDRRLALFRGRCSVIELILRQLGDCGSVIGL